jgi:hypothetical protein
MADGVPDDAANAAALLRGLWPAVRTRLGAAPGSRLETHVSLDSRAPGRTQPRRRRHDAGTGVACPTSDDSANSNAEADEGRCGAGDRRRT